MFLGSVLGFLGRWEIVEGEVVDGLDPL